MLLHYTVFWRVRQHAIYEYSYGLWQSFAYSTRHNYTGRGPNVQKSILRSPGQPKLRLSNFYAWKWYIWLLQQIFAGRPSEKCIFLFQQPDLGLPWDSTPPVQPSRLGAPTPAADFSILPSGYYYAI